MKRRNILKTIAALPLFFFLRPNLAPAEDSKPTESKPTVVKQLTEREVIEDLKEIVYRLHKKNLFALNDHITRTAFREDIVSYLNKLKMYHRAPIEHFQVLCDHRNNTPEVIDEGSFRADIVIKFSKSLELFVMNFSTKRTSVSFEEVKYIS